MFVFCLFVFFVPVDSQCFEGVWSSYLIESYIYNQLTLAENTHLYVLAPFVLLNWTDVVYILFSTVMKVSVQLNSYQYQCFSALRQFYINILIYYTFSDQVKCFVFI